MSNKTLANALITLAFLISITLIYTTSRINHRLKKIQNTSHHVIYDVVKDLLINSNDRLEAKLIEQPIIENLAPFLRVYSAYDQNGALKLIRLGQDHDGGYIIPEKALKTAEVLLGYGIFNDISFEEDFSSKYNKPSYGFDCGIEGIEIKNKLFSFIPECVGTDKFLYTHQESNKKISSFSQQLDRLNLNDKKVFIKMDIEGAEYEAFDGILKHSDNITGIAMEIHFMDFGQPAEALKLLSKLSKDFVLVHLHGNNYVSSDNSFFSINAIGKVTKVLELTYINKSLVTNYHISDNQKHPLPIDMPCLKGTKEVEFEILTDGK
jgi:hypothetical protein